MSAKFKMGDEVYFYAKPSHLNSFPEAFTGEDAETRIVYQARIYKVSVTAESVRSVYEDKDTETVVYEAIGMDDFFGSVRLTDNEIFSDEQSALTHALDDIQRTVKSLQNKLSIYENILANNSIKK